MKGKITSLVGNKIIVRLDSSPIDATHGEIISVGKKRIGRVSEIIGNTTSPYLVVNLFPKTKLDSSSLIGEEISL